MKKYFMIILPFLLFLAGCEAALLIGPAIQAYVVWKNGEGFKYYNYDYNTVFRATEKALHDLDYKITKEEATKKGQYIVASSAHDFKINIEKVESNVTIVRMRINFMGDKPYAEMIYQVIDQNLGIIEYENGIPKSPKNMIDDSKNKRRGKQDTPDEPRRRVLRRAKDEF